MFQWYNHPGTLVIIEQDGLLPIYPEYLRYPMIFLVESTNKKTNKSEFLTADGTIVEFTRHAEAIQFGAAIYPIIVVAT